MVLPLILGAAALTSVGGWLGWKANNTYTETFEPKVQTAKDAVNYTAVIIAGVAAYFIITRAGPKLKKVIEGR